jgi:hypothetical protein
MPIFARLRLQAMLDDLVQHAHDHKLRYLRARLESKRVEQALPAEIERGVLCGPKTVTKVTPKSDVCLIGRARPTADIALAR